MRAIRLHIGTGMFWFWDQPWWAELSDLALGVRGIEGVQILCDPLNGRPPLPPVRVVRELVATMHVTLHPSFFDVSSIRYTPELERALDGLQHWLQQTGVRDLVVHSNHFARGAEDFQALSARLPGSRLLVENVGARAAFGHAPADVRRVLELDASIGFVLDLAHLSEVSVPHNCVESWLDDPVIAARLHMLHVSTSGIAHPELHDGCPAEISEADHLPMFLRPEPLSADVASTLAKHPIVTEGCLPSGTTGVQWLDREVEHLRKYFIVH